MKDATSESAGRGAGHASPRQVTPTDELFNNLPYILMTVLGGSVFFLGLSESAWGWAAGGGFLIYGVAGAFWVIIFMCPFCEFWGTRSCTRGYGRIAFKLRARQSEDRLAEKLKVETAMVVPLWFLPLVVGVPILIRDFSWGLLVVLITFAVNSFGLLPVVARRHRCRECMLSGRCSKTPGEAHGAGQTVTPETSDR